MTRTIAGIEQAMHRPGVGMAVLRVVLGVVFMYHGFGKLTGIEGTAGFFGSLGIPAPLVAAWAVALIEFLGGLALVLGVGARIAAVALVPVMVGAIATVHLPSGFGNTNIVGMSEAGPVFGMPGWEFNLVLIAGLAAVTFAGAGRWALAPVYAGAEPVGMRTARA
jgi:putative oxidoreductase